MDNTTALLQASLRMERIIKARRILVEAGGCEDEVEKLDDKIHHLKMIKKIRLEKERDQSRDQRIAEAVI